MSALGSELPSNLRVNPPFSLLYDLRWMVLGQAGGVEQATYELISAIGHLDRKNAYRVFAPRSTCWEWDFPDRFQVTRHYSDGGADGRALRCDLVLSTCSFIQPELVDRRGVLTIHDLQHLHYPEFFSAADRQERDSLYRVSAERARHIICISDFTRRDVHQRFGIPLERMTTVWNIPTDAAWRELPRRISAGLVERMGISTPFLLYPAQSWPHKNHLRLLQAMERVADDLAGEVKLVLAGRSFELDHPARQLLANPRIAKRVIHVGFRSPLEMRALFQECMALVFPSLFEGFGMPVAEAIIASKPVACSNVTSLPEIAGEAALTFNPADVDAIAGAIMQIAGDPELRRSLQAASVKRRAVFSARASATRTLAVYEQAMAS